jgi:hypothetical protein
VEDVELAGVGTGDRFETADPFEFALEGTIVIERATVDDLHRAPDTQDAPSEPHLAITAAPNAADQLMIRDGWRFGGAPGV